MTLKKCNHKFSALAKLLFAGAYTFSIQQWNCSNYFLNKPIPTKKKKNTIFTVFHVFLIKVQILDLIKKIQKLVFSNEGKWHIKSVFLSSHSSFLKSRFFFLWLDYNLRRLLGQNSNISRFVLNIFKPHQFCLNDIQA